MDRWATEATAAKSSAATAISLGYLERLRLGLGTPFRLAELALHDPRLDATRRRELAWAILARTADREAYRVDPAALDGIALTDASARAGSAGAAHLRLIGKVISESPDPRTGELAVRLAYARAAADGVVSREGPLLAARAGALLRDRELARHDVLRLLDVKGGDPLTQLGLWRAERRFAVESPALSARAAGMGEHAAALSVGLGRDIREVARRPARGAPAAPPVSPSLLGPTTARQLAALIAAANPPPQAAVTVPVADHRARILGVPALDDRARRARDRFLERAVSEEAFAAEYALLLADPAVESTAAGVALSVAVALRAYAQEPVWFPGFPAPTGAALETRHGLAEVRFTGVPVEWEPYYRRMIDLALTDLRRVLPSLALTGLRVTVSGAGVREGTLALHDPRRRRLILPAHTGAGAIAHEIAHDLDWQVALSRYGVRGDYASDGAPGVRGDALAARLTHLAQASMDAAANGGQIPQTHRPTEVFARSLDWFVAATLAAQGRSNGYLTSIQDDVLTGYGSAQAPNVTGVAGAALIHVLDEVAPLDPITREAFLTRYGRAKTLSPNQ